jgi:hypothetical protein
VSRAGKSSFLMPVPRGNGGCRWCAVGTLGGPNSPRGSGCPPPLPWSSASCLGDSLRLVASETTRFHPVRRLDSSFPSKAKSAGSVVPTTVGSVTCGADTFTVGSGAGGGRGACVEEGVEAGGVVEDGATTSTGASCGAAAASRSMGRVTGQQAQNQLTVQANATRACFVRISTHRESFVGTDPSRCLCWAPASSDCRSTHVGVPAPLTRRSVVPGRLRRSRAEP